MTLQAWKIGEVTSGSLAKPPHQMLCFTKKQQAQRATSCADRSWADTGLVNQLTRFRVYPGVHQSDLSRSIYTTVQGA